MQGGICFNTFKEFAGAGLSTLDSKSFAKLCRDSNLLGENVTAADVDLTFAKVVPKKTRRMDVSHFEAALLLIAEKKGVSTKAIRRMVGDLPGPLLRATQPEPVPFHDDRNSYTGTWVNGGPERPPKAECWEAPAEALELRQPWQFRKRLAGARRAPREEVLVSRLPVSRPSSADVARGRRPASAPAGGRRPSSATAAASGVRPSSAPAAGRVASPGDPVRRTFARYCGERMSMDNATFAKLCRASGLVPQRSPAGTAAIDLAFVGAVPRGARRLELPHFELALELLAGRLGVDIDAARETVATHRGPTLRGTKAASVRFHDDKSTYTGCHARGGPEPVPKSSHNFRLWFGSPF